MLIFNMWNDPWITLIWFLKFKPWPNKVAQQLVMVANLIDLARGFWDVSKLDSLIMTIDLV